MKTFIIVSHRIPTNFNEAVSHVVEAEDGPAAQEIVRHHLRDLADQPRHTYQIKPYKAPPPGHIISSNPIKAP